MKIEKILKEDLDILKIDSSLSNRLKNIDIINIEDLWKCERNYLKDNNFSNSDICQIKIKLQLVGLDLNKKIIK